MRDINGCQTKALRFSNELHPEERDEDQGGAYGCPDLRKDYFKTGFYPEKCKLAFKQQGTFKVKNQLKLLSILSLKSKSKTGLALVGLSLV